MKTRVIILAGGEGTRLGVLTAKRTKPAVPFGGKYRIIDFPLSNCVNSNLVDVMIVAQYRPHSLLQHIGAGGPWDLNRDIRGGVRIFTPFKSPTADWFVGTADAIQQNFSFIKRGDPDLILILSGDHIYKMDYEPMIQFHLAHQAELTIATIEVSKGEASRFGIVGIDADHYVTSFVEKPKEPPSNLANMGVYLFNRDLLDRALWEDHLQKESSHDFGKDILPRLVKSGTKVLAYPHSGYWVDVGTVNSYWQAHMDLLATPSTLNLFDRSWIVHTRTEERPPAKLYRGAIVEDSLICDGCIIEENARVRCSILSPGVIVKSGAEIHESILLTDDFIENDVQIKRSILDKRVHVGKGSKIGEILEEELSLTMIGRDSVVPDGTIVRAGGTIGTDVCPTDYNSLIIQSGEYIQTRRLPNEIQA
jgi:glucose-1-phosphate adenylyltransferase